MVDFVNPFVEIARSSSKESYGIFMVERNILKNRKNACEEKLMKTLIPETQMTLESNAITVAKLGCGD